MLDSENTLKAWGEITSIADAYELIDYGVIIDAEAARRLKRQFDNDSIQEVISYIAHRFSERYENQLSSEILLETLLVLLHTIDGEDLVYRFIGTVVNFNNNFECSAAMIRILFKLDMVNHENPEELLSTTVLLVSELGIVFWKYAEEFPESEKKVLTIIDSITSYLQSITNENNPYVRLSLLRYFGIFNVLPRYSEYFNRVLGRFGHTVIEQLFIQLMSRKNEGMALDFLTMHIPHVLESNQHGQQILHANFRHFMMKNHERFIIFLQTLCQNIIDSQDERIEKNKKALLQHMVALFAVSNELNHKELGRDISLLIMKVLEEYNDRTLMLRLLSGVQLKPAFREFAASLTSASSNEELMHSIRKFKSSKRGRKPSFAKGIESNSVTLMRRLGDSILKAS